jgi:hypothetical protein
VLSRKQQSIFEQFDRAPDDTLIIDPVSAKLLGMSVWTLNRTNPVAKRRISERISGRRAGDIRALLRGETVAA